MSSGSGEPAVCDYRRESSGSVWVLPHTYVPETMRDRMQKCDVDEADILAAAREAQGLERLDQIKFAVLERNGGITIVPAEKE